ncbi:MAG: winged helix-turn-helix domain-containing protein [Oscillospiraceae bacterium]|nr:winged helix-turn-helix domain-containing protein [Oscillospiraceae bacterium]
MTFPGLEIMVNQYAVYRDRQLVSLTKREFLTLVFLARRPNWIFTAQQIYDEVWDDTSGDCGKAVATIIGQIRRKLTPDTPTDGYIQTMIGRGYKFVIPS